MSVSVLHDKIRKLKNPSMVDFSVKTEHLPPHLLEDGNPVDAYLRFCKELLDGLKGIVPAVRFRFNNFAMMGPQALQQLPQILRQASDLGFYVVLDAGEMLSPWAAEQAADVFFGGDTYCCDGLVISPYIGSDAIRLP